MLGSEAQVLLARGRAPHAHTHGAPSYYYTCQVWAEGADGAVHLDVLSISAAAPPALSTSLASSCSEADEASLTPTPSPSHTLTLTNAHTNSNPNPNQAGEAACDADAGCTWCKCAGPLPSQCWTLEVATQL